MTALPTATTSDLALASFAMIEALYRELVSAGVVSWQVATDVLQHAALIVEAKPHGDSAARVIRSLPLAQHRGGAG